MTVDQALEAIELITMRGKQHLDEKERASVRAILVDLALAERYRS
jgi:hypothetical protein